MFFARRFVYNNIILCGDSAHSWPPFGGLAGNTGYSDANNLGWKLCGLLEGWANKGILESYDLERRLAGLRTIITVLSFIPDRKQLIRLAIIADNPYLWWTAQYRWKFANSGAHAGNHFMCEGLNFGTRYSSHIVYRNKEHQGVDPLECPPSIYTPIIVSGGHLPHVLFEDKRTLFDLIDVSGYTLLVIDAAVEVKDALTQLPEEIFIRMDSESSISGRTIGEPMVKELVIYFQLRRIPLKVVDIHSRLTQISDPAMQQLANLFLKTRVVLVRPDLYVSWFLSTEAFIISTFELQRVSQHACAEIYDTDQIKACKGTLSWLTKRFIDNIQGARAMFGHAIYIENEDKAVVLEKIAQKNKIDPNHLTLTTKGELVTNSMGKSQEMISYKIL